LFFSILTFEELNSRIFEDTQLIIQEIASKYTNVRVIKTKKITSNSDGFITFKDANE